MRSSKLFEVTLMHIGFEVAVVDFGAGGSSIPFLSRVPDDDERYHFAREDFFPGVERTASGRAHLLEWP